MLALPPVKSTGRLGAMGSAKGFKLTNTITAGLSFPAAVSVNFGGSIYVANNGGNNITIYNQALQQTGPSATQV